MLTPVIFAGHGSPMNALASNRYTESLARLGASIAKPRAILMISAHWMTDGTHVTHMPSPPTIHDFHGFPQALFEIQYPAPGLPELAEQIAKSLSKFSVHLDDREWGLDHGCWSVLLHMYPEAKIPVVQLSLDIRKPGSHHFQIGQALRALRREGVLIVGSGNIVHNLRTLDWSQSARPLDWATKYDEHVKEQLLKGNFQNLADNYVATSEGRLSVPTPDHYLPLLYVLGAVESGETPTFIYEGIEHASISMRTFAYGMP